MSDQTSAVAVQADGSILTAVTVFDPLLQADRIPTGGYLVRRFGE